MTLQVCLHNYSTDLLQMLRFGGSGIKGGYADVVPSLSQYVTGRTGFVVRSATDQVLVGVVFLAVDWKSGSEGLAYFFANAF